MKPTIFTDALRKEICTTHSYWIEARHADISVTDAVDHDWRNDKVKPTLRKVIYGLVDRAYLDGVEAGKEEVRKNLRLALFGKEDGACHDHSDPHL